MPENEKGERYENLIDQSIVTKTRCFFHTQKYRLPGGQQKGRCRHRDLPDQQGQAEERNKYARMAQRHPR